MKVYEVPVQPVGFIPVLTSLPGRLRFRGLDLLLNVGIACTRPEIAGDPERLFALFRYATKISATGQNMALTHDVAEMDVHKKAVLSDEFGCGFSFLASYALVGASTLLDTSTAIRRGWVKTASRRSQLPDYVGWSTTNKALIVLEAKGTQSTGYCRRQIARGCEQVKGVMLPQGVSSVRIAVGVELRRVDQEGQTTVFVGDPESTDQHEYAFVRPYSEAIVRGHYARVASLIGDGEMLRRLGEYHSEGDSALQVLEGPEHTYVGSTLRFTGRDGSATLFVGIDREIRGYLLESTRYASVLERLNMADGGDTSQGAPDHVRRTDGTLLALELEGPLSEPNQ